MKVSIHAQVIRERSFDWFYTLRQRAPSGAGELKSPAIVDVFFALPEYERRKIWLTLKTVRIHITDPRPYVRTDLSDLVQDGDVPRFIKRLDKAVQQAAERERGRLIAQKMWQDAPSQQINLKYLVWEYQLGLRISGPLCKPLVDEGIEAEPPKNFDLTLFERPSKNIVNVLSGFLSKSESVFCDALDSMGDIIERGTRSSSPAWHQISEILSTSHAFDKGDSKEVPWIVGERRDVMTRLDRHRIFHVQPGPLVELDSKESFLVQAADFAAGIARETWHRKSLAHLVGAFDYVTYNGKRISETEAGTIRSNTVAGSKAS